MMKSPLHVGGMLCAVCGVASLVPVMADGVGNGRVRGPDVAVGVLGVLLALTGGVILGLGWRRHGAATVPAPVRAAMLGNILFLSFCVLEFSDGWVRQGGRVFYWTSVLFLPALLLLHGLATGRRWAWWTARGATAILILWFMAFLFYIPAGDLRRGGEAVPWGGKIYMMGFTLALAALVAVVFRALGSAEARRYFQR